jgi:hypothetical protein
LNLYNAHLLKGTRLKAGLEGNQKALKINCDCVSESRSGVGKELKECEIKVDRMF